MRTRQKIITVIAIILALMIVGVFGVAIPQLGKLDEFSKVESVKGYWASLQDFQKQHGRYPKDEAEIAAFFHIGVGTAPAHYVPPHDDTADEPILWWKEKTRSGVTVGITEAGSIVKK
jgi:hypothetical protein